MMINLSYRARANRSFGRGLVAAGVVVGCALAWLAPLPPSITTGVLGINEAIVRSADRPSPARIVGAMIADRSELVAENEALRRELAEHTLAEEFASALVLVDAKEREARTYAPAGTLVARVMRTPSQSLSDRLVIDLGAREGIAAGDLVTYHGVALGEVVASYAGSARVELFSNHGRSFVALLAPTVGTSTASSTDRSVAVRGEGVGGGMYRLTAPREVAVAVGDLVYLPLDRLHVVARVEAVERDPLEPTQTVFAHIPVALSSMLAVEVRPLPEAFAQ